MEDAIVELGILGVLGWVFFGLIIGLMARALLPGRDPMGLIATTLLGIVGALVGGWAGQILGFYAPGSRAGFLAAIIGAVALLVVYRQFAIRRSQTVVRRALRGGMPRRLRGRWVHGEESRDDEQKSA